MLGLHREHLVVADPDPGWEQCFIAAQQALFEAVGGVCLRIEHIGSTSVPGLPAKPIIDIGILLEGPDKIADLKAPLARLGYIDRGDKGDRGGYLFVLESAPEIRTHHLHVIVSGDPAWERYLEFRDALRGSRRLRDAYASLKRTLRTQLGADRKGYTDGKTAFIESVLRATG